MSTDNNIDGLVSLGASISLGASLANTNHTLQAIGSLRAEVDGDDAVDQWSSPAVNYSGGMNRSVHAFDSIVVPHTAEEELALKTAKEKLNAVRGNGTFAEVEAAEEAVKLAERWDIRSDVLDHLVRPPQYDGETGKLVDRGGLIARAVDLIVKKGDKERVAVSFLGKVPQWVRNRDSVKEAVTKAVVARQERIQNCPHTQRMFKAVVEHENSVITDVPRDFEWTKGEHGLDANYLLPVKTEAMDNILTDLGNTGILDNGNAISALPELASA